MHHKFIPEGARVNKEGYKEMLTQLEKCDCPKTEHSCMTMPYLTNYCLYRSNLLNMVLIVLPHPPYSPNLVP